MISRGIAAACALAVVATGVVGCSSGGGSGASNWYRHGYNAGVSQASGMSQTDTISGNAYCTQYWNDNEIDSSSTPSGQPIEDYSSGWIAACEHAPYGQSGVDVPGSGQGPNNSNGSYPASEGQ